MQTKKFRLDLSEYTVKSLVPKPTEENPHAMAEEGVPYPLRENFNTWLRSSGIFRSAEDIVEAIDIAKQIRDCKEDFVILDERETEVLKKAMNRLVELTAEGKANLGGPTHEEAICRVVKMQEVQ